MSKKTPPSIQQQVLTNELVWQGSTSNISKAKKDFNKALSNHKQTIAKANEVEEYLSLAHNAYVNDIIPELTKQQELYKMRLEMMHDIYIDEVVNLGKYQRECLRQMILEECVDNLQSNYDYYHKIILKLETTAEKTQRLHSKINVEKEIKKHFGFDVDIDELNKSEFANEEERLNHEGKFKDFFEKYTQQDKKYNDDYFEQMRNQKERKKSKTQTDREQKQAEAEKLLNTDINKLFKELAKLIHPDREQDPLLRDKKEALMKELSHARDSTNIAEILRIKLLVDDLIPNNTSMSFNDETIKRFATIIKSKIKELEMMISQKLYSHPVFTDLNARNLSLQGITKHINNEVILVKQETQHQEKIINAIVNNPKKIKTLIDDYIISTSSTVYW